jgi:hypothetical protein
MNGVAGRFGGLCAACALAFLVHACGAKTDDTTGIEGNTNWLRYCVADADCSPTLRCLCNTCTVECGTDAECSGPPGLACLVTSDVALQCAGAPERLCSRVCQLDADCVGSQTCSGGACVALSTSATEDFAGISGPTAEGILDAGMPQIPPDGSIAFLPAPICVESEMGLLCVESLPYTLYTYEDGECVRREACLEPIARRGFFTLEECRAVCEGRPAARACPEGTEPRSICIECSLESGCRQREVCAVPCTEHAQCRAIGGCVEGYCQAGPPCF